MLTELLAGLTAAEPTVPTAEQIGAAAQNLATTDDVLDARSAAQTALAVLTADGATPDSDIAAAAIAVFDALDARTVELAAAPPAEAVPAADQATVDRLAQLLTPPAAPAEAQLSTRPATARLVRNPTRTVGGMNAAVADVARDRGIAAPAAETRAPGRFHSDGESFETLRDLVRGRGIQNDWRNAEHARQGFRTTLVRLALDDHNFDMRGRGAEQPDLSAIIAAAVAGADAITASGGVCAPYQTIFDILVFAVADRPLRDALPKIAMNRGGLLVRAARPLPAAGAAGTIGLGVGIYTAVQDASNTAAAPQTAVKTVSRYDCLSPQTYLLDSIYRQMQVGNLSLQFDAQGVEAAALTMAAALARASEAAEINRIAAFAATTQTARQYAGAYADAMSAVKTIAAAMRYRQRLGDRELTAVLPIELVEAISADIARTLPSIGSAENVSNQQIADVIMAANIRPVLSRDFPGMFGAAPVAPQDLQRFSLSFPGLMFASGAVVHLDGGELDLGVVTDAASLRTNDRLMFAETFESTAFLGNEVQSFNLQLEPNGARALGADPTLFNAGGDQSTVTKRPATPVLG